jgi:hypothetical protein
MYSKEMLARLPLSFNDACHVGKLLVWLERLRFAQSQPSGKKKDSSFFLYSQLFFK